MSIKILSKGNSIGCGELVLSLILKAIKCHTASLGTEQCYNRANHTVLNEAQYQNHKYKYQSWWAKQEKGQERKNTKLTREEKAISDALEGLASPDPHWYIGTIQQLYEFIKTLNNLCL